MWWGREGGGNIHMPRPPRACSNNIGRRAQPGPRLEHRNKADPVNPVWPRFESDARPARGLPVARCHSVRRRGTWTRGKRRKEKKKKGWPATTLQPGRTLVFHPRGPAPDHPDPPAPLGIANFSLWSERRRGLSGLRSPERLAPVSEAGQTREREDEEFLLFFFSFPTAGRGPRNLAGRPCETADGRRRPNERTSFAPRNGYACLIRAVRGPRPPRARICYVGLG